jgi:hypothetical protein
MPTNDQPLGAGVLEVTSPDELAALAGLRLRWPTAATIALRLPFVEAALQQATERRLNFLRGVCGCQAGTLFALAALAWFIASPAPESGSTLAMVLHGAAFVVGMAILGKALAIVAARAIFASQASSLARRARRLAERGVS